MAEATLYVGEATDEENFIVEACRTLLNVEIIFPITVDLKCLYSALSTQRNSICRSVSDDVNLIRYNL